MRFGNAAAVLSFALAVLAACAESTPTNDAPVTHHAGLGAGGTGGALGVPTGGAAGKGAGGSTGGGSTGSAGGAATAGKGGGGSTGASGGASGASAAGSSGTAGTGGAAGASGTPACATTFTYHPSAAVTNVVVAGEWNGFDLAKATPLTKDASGAFVGTVSLPPGLAGYKLVVDGTWQLDPGQGRRKYVGGVENSGMKVGDCLLPTLRVTSSTPLRPSPGAGTYQATLSFADGVEASGADVAGFSASLVAEGAATPLDAGAAKIAPSGDVTVSLAGLADGKYTVVVVPKSKNGRVGAPQRLPFWIEAESFSWKDALVYMVMTDRFQNGDAANDGPKTAGVDPRADFQGGDLQGLRAAIDAGVLDQLGVRALWISPFHENPKDAWPAADGIHQVMGYHGYWPTKGRAVDARLGGEAALKAVVKAAHAHGIRILQDYVVNHVHQEHEYFAAHPEWFRTGCVCGTANCDWTTHALDCLFAPYMPDVNHTVPEATAQWTADAVWWLDTFDLDGLRIDAVKHVEEAATRNLAAEVRETFEAAGTRYFLMGETAMGWIDCPDPCNDENYGTISKYIGPLGLDGQFDFVLYHGVSYRTFGWGQKGMLHADYWLQHGQEHYPPEAIMTPYVGSHDTSRIVTMADYRDGAGAKAQGIAGNQWDNVAAAPTDAEPYARTRLAFAWLLGLPGAPLLYFGDEYGQWGGADPNNRAMWRGGGTLSPDEQETLAFVRKMGLARKNVPALRRGTYVPFPATTDDTLVFGRKVALGDAAVVALTRLATAQSASLEVGKSLGLAPGSVLHDRLGGPDATVAADGSVTVSVPAKGAVVLAP